MTKPTSPAPRHLWVVAVLSLLWNSMGALDYTMTETRNAAYLKDFTPEQLAYFTSFPKWVIATWALAVWGGVAGSVALFWRSRWAATIFLVSLVSMLITFAHNYLLSDGYRIMGGAGAAAFTATIVGVGVLVLAYARRMAQRGVLR